MPLNVVASCRPRRPICAPSSSATTPYVTRPRSSTPSPVIPGSLPFYNALTLALVGDFARFDDPRAVVKLAGSEVNHYASGDWKGSSRISHRGRSALRAAAYHQARMLVARNPDLWARFHALVHRTTRRSLAPQEAYVAIMNSYLRIAHNLVTRGELYRPLSQRSPT